MLLGNEETEELPKRESRRAWEFAANPRAVRPPR
jgi:hypothetical protein